MKLNLKTAAVILLAVAAMCGVLTCVNQNVHSLGTEAELEALTVGDVDADQIPAPIPANVWDADIRSLYSEDFAGMEFKRESEITAARIKPIASPGAKVEWNIGSRTYCPDDFIDTRVPATFESDEYIYIKVTSEDEQTVNYYRFYTRVYSWVTDLATISIREREAKPKKGTKKYDDLLTVSSSTNDFLSAINITTPEATGTVITPVTFDPNATVRFAKTTGTAEPSFVSVDTPLSFADQDFLYVEVTAENTVDVSYFKFRVNVGRMATIKTLKFLGGPKDKGGGIELYGKGLPGIVWANVGPGDWATAAGDQPGGGFGIDIVLDDTDGTYGWQIITKQGDGSIGGQPSFTLNNGGTKQKFENGDYLAISVKSLNGNVYNYYQIRVTLLAANIIEQPKSAWYYREDVKAAGVDPAGKNPVAALSIAFEDGTNDSGFTYQWYTADSLFGFYGRHGMSIDEKNNVSTINGGPDMYYYLAQPGIDQMGKRVPEDHVYDPSNPKSMSPLAWAITGATSLTYTPPNNWKDVPVKLPKGSGQNNSYPYDPSSALYDSGPTDQDAPSGGWPTHAPENVNFISGSTSEVRYYWVVVTDSNGYKATSDRAVILTETKPEMYHYIFNLSKLPVRKNPSPFKKLRELYKIEIPANYFPAGFDPSKFQSCIAQAQYFLPDGRPWTQNWTHGDLHFGYADDSLTWWHNNLGANAGAIPLQSPHSAQGGLSFPPNWVGFAPSGDVKRGLPPLDSKTGKLPVGNKPTMTEVNQTQGDGSYPTGQAQGYFCGFIELMELRFALPPPK